MTMPPSERLASLRRANAVAQACELLPSVLVSENASLALYEEAARVALLGGQLALAQQIFAVLCDAPGVKLEPAWVLRLQLASGDDTVLERAQGRLLLIDGNVRWLGALLENGVDVVLHPEVRRARPMGWQGVLQARVDVACPSCGAAFPVWMVGTFAAAHELLCPACFGRLELDGDDVARYAEHAGSEDFSLDVRVLEFSNRALSLDAQVPLFCRNLGQDNAVLLSRMAEPF